MRGKKLIPNIITVFRLALSPALLFIQPLSASFFILYLLLGLSDMLDGYIARRLKAQTRLGAALDSAADFVLCAVLLCVFLPLIEWKRWMQVWIGAVAVLKLATLIIGMIKYRAPAFLHTYANKATGLLLFCFPVLYTLLGLNTTAAALCTVVSAAAAEELCITVLSNTLNENIKHLPAQIKLRRRV